MPMQSTEVRFASFLSGGFITVIVVNPPESKLAKRTSVQSAAIPSGHYRGFWDVCSGNRTHDFASIE